MRLKSALLRGAIAAMLSMTPIHAQSMDSGPAPAASPELQAGRRAVEAKDWNGAIRSLTSAAQRDARNADIQNLLGYAYRNAGQLEPAFQHYQRALQLDPRHLGTHEYIGEAYLMANNLAKAEEHLAALKRFCPAMCEEYDDLKRKIDDYRTRAR
jgi:Flp pilus assembly protein TadD